MRRVVIVAALCSACVGCQRATRAACAMNDTTSASDRFATAIHSIVVGDTGRTTPGCAS